MISGALGSSEGRPIEGGITIYSSTATPRADSHLIAAGGTYSTRVDFSERMLVVASSDGHAEDELRISSAPESGVVQSDFVLPPVGVVSGRVVDANGVGRFSAIEIRYVDRPRRARFGGPSGYLNR